MLTIKEKINIARTGNNILFSLDYLRREAEREGNSDLSLILEIAHQLASYPSISHEVLSRVSRDDDALKAALFVVKFLSASKEIQGDVISRVESRNDCNEVS